MRIVALDLSLIATGWAVNWNEAKAKQTKGYIGVPVKFGTVTLDKAVVKRGGIFRLARLVQTLKEKVVGAHFVVMEDLAFAARDRNHERAGLAYIIRYRLFLAEIPYVLIAPTTLKKFVTGAGNSEKSRMVLTVFKRWGIETANDNEADAIGLLQIGRMLTGAYQPTNKAEREVFSTVRAALSVEMLRLLGVKDKKVA